MVVFVVMPTITKVYMTNKNRGSYFFVSSLLALSLLSSIPASLFSDVSVNSSNFTGSRNKALFSNPSGGITATGLATLLGESISWQIVQNGSNYQYIYNISNINGLSALQSQLFIETGANTTVSNFSNISVNSGLLSGLTGVSATNSTVGSDKGVLFSSTGSILINQVSFTSSAAPIWGDFQAGAILSSSSVYQNTGFGTAPTTSPFTNWVPIPGQSVIATPEPSTYLILGSTLFITFLFRRKVYA